MSIRTVNMTLNVKLGEPYEKFIRDVMKRGYASSQTEVIRQALTVYRREMERVYERPTSKAVEREMELIQSKKTNTKPLEKIKKEFGL
ncbi:MAG: hypothetical protein ABIF01_00885 [Candidatus Micrarchaeota archaeon]